jgi:hypothetical protein
LRSYKTDFFYTDLHFTIALYTDIMEPSPSTPPPSIRCPIKKVDDEIRKIKGGLSLLLGATFYDGIVNYTNKRRLRSLLWQAELRRAKILATDATWTD